MEQLKTYQEMSFKSKIMNEPTPLQKAVELLPCPFCGEQVTFLKGDVSSIGGRIIHAKNICCLADNMQSNHSLGDPKFVAKWNNQFAAKQLEALKSTHGTLLIALDYNRNERDSLKSALKMCAEALKWYAGLHSLEDYANDSGEKAQEALAHPLVQQALASNPPIN